MKTYNLKKCLTDDEVEKLKTTFLDDNSFDTLITSDCDGYDLYGNLLFRYRKNAIPFDVLKSGYDAFKDSISLTDGRGAAAGGYKKRINNDGRVSNISIADKVFSGNVGYMDASSMVPYCRKTAFASKYFEKFQQGVPFVEFIDKKYAELCPEHYAKQIAIARGTNKNYRIADTSFTTVTVNRNFQTAVHQDSGDFREGFGNLIIYREGDYKGAYFCLPQYRVAIDMHNCDLLFVDVHKWHGNTPFTECSEDYMRVAFVLYYREQMYLCKQPKDELQQIKQDKGGFLRL